MGIDSIKPGGGSIPVSQPKPVDDVKAPAAAETAAPGQAAQVQTEAYDDPKQKLVSVTGGYKPYTPNFATRPDLVADVAAQRGVGGPKPLQDKGGTDTIASKGAAPPGRDASADFVAQAKASGAKTPDEIEAKACSLAKAAIEKDFGMKVKSGDASWKAEELTRAYESFKSMPAGDREKLKGLDLIREHNAPPESNKEAGGIVAGEYSPNVETKDGQRVKPGSITAYDAAFGASSRQDSISVLTHEAGHAVEGRSRDDAMAAHNAAIDVQNAKSAVDKTNADANKAQWSDTNRAAGALGGASSKDKPKYDFVLAEKKVLTALDKLQKADTPKKLADAQAELATAKTKRDTALAGMSGHKSEGKAQDLVSASDQQEATALAFAKSHLDWKDAKSAADDKGKALTAVSTSASGGTTKELAAFVKARGKESPVSGYGAKKSQEGYAEAYALYQRDPSYLQQHYPRQYDYFHANHQSPRDP